MINNHKSMKMDYHFQKIFQIFLQDCHQINIHQVILNNNKKKSIIGLFCIYFTSFFKKAIF